MVNIHDCLQRAIDAKGLNPVRGAAAQGEFAQLVDRYSGIYPIHQAQAMAAADLKGATRKAANSRFHAVVNQLQAMRRIRHQIETAPDPAVAVRNLMEYSPGSGFKGENVRYQAEAIINSINAGLYDFLQKTHTNVAGFSRAPVLLKDVIRELHGDATGSGEAAKLAGAVRQQQKRMRQMFNAHGGDIGELADYGVPHSHDVSELRRVGSQKWADDIHDKLAWHRIDDATTGKPFAAKGDVPDRAVSKRFLKDVYDGITTRGWDERDPMMSVGGKALYNQRGEHRVLHFGSGDDWLEYNKVYGGSDPFSAMIGGLHGLANDVALMRVLGPNPRAGLEYAHQVAQKRASELGNAKLESRVNAQGKLAKTMLAHQNGDASVPANEAWAKFSAGTRGYLVSTHLGSAVISSVTDGATLAQASRVMGMHPTNVMAKTVSLSASQATRETAARMGFVATTLADAGSGSARYFGRLFGSGVADRLANFTLRASGLTFITDMRRIAFQMELAGLLAENAGRSFDAIDAPLKYALETRGIGAADWDQLRTVLFTANNGATFLTPFHWLEHQTNLPRAEAEGLAGRLQMIFQERMELAVPTASLEGRARMLGDSAPGSIPGELLRSSTSYKSFTVTLMLNQYRQFMDMPTPMAKAQYAASMSVSLLLLGALAVQLKEIAKGNDPRPMTEKKFWMAAMFQGGGLGIFGDFFSSETSRIGGGIGETVAGPVVGLAGDLVGPIASNFTRAVEGKDTLLGRDLSNLARYNTPVFSSLWTARLAYDRIVADTLQSFLDPEAEHVWRRQQRQRDKSYGNTTWWQRGEYAPERGPDLSNAVRMK